MKPAYFVYLQHHRWVEDENANVLFRTSESPNGNHLDMLLQADRHLEKNGYAVQADHRFLLDYPKEREGWTLISYAVYKAKPGSSSVPRILDDHALLYYIRTDDPTQCFGIQVVPNNRSADYQVFRYGSGDNPAVYASEMDARDALFASLDKMRLRILL